MLSIFVGVLLSARLISGWECGGDRSELNNFDPEIQKRDLQSAPYYRDYVYNPIRLTFEYYNFSLGFTQSDDYLKSTLIQAARNFFQRALKVRPLTNPLKLHSTNCLSAVIVPSTFYKNGSPNTDIVVFVTSNNLTASYVAYAGACEYQSSDNNNIVAGTIVINAPQFGVQTLSGKVTVLIHEMTHLLGFAANLYSFFKDSSGLAYTTSIKTTVRGVTKFLFTGPNALAKAREALGCPTLAGIELEEYGLGSYAGSHWDKRHMFNDYMICYVGIDAMPTTVTLGLLADSGWYRVDYTAAVVPVFGRGTGCKFIDTKCVASGISTNSSMWCTASQGWTCDLFALYKSYCSYTTYSTALPASFQYFTNTLAGGGDAYADYCPYKKPYNNGACMGGGVSTYTTTYANEVVGPNSRCFDSTLALKPYEFKSPYSACYEVTGCNTTHATVAIAGNLVYCPFTGLIITLPGYTGKLNCPASDILCNDVPCQNFCFGRGNCVKGKCICSADFGSFDCSVVCPSKCLTCTSSTQCTSCISPNLLINGLCLPCPFGCATCSGLTCLSCSAGFYLSSGSCASCPSLCKTCTSLTSCQSCVANYMVSSEKCVFMCAAGCSACTSTTICTECITGYYLSSSVCYLCPTGCIACTSVSACTSCVSGTTITAGICKII